MVHPFFLSLEPRTWSKDTLCKISHSIPLPASEARWYTLSATVSRALNVNQHSFQCILMSYNLLPTSSLWQLKLSRKFDGKLTSTRMVMCHLYNNLCHFLPEQHRSGASRRKLNQTNYFHMRVKFKETQERRRNSKGPSAVNKFLWGQRLA